MFILVWLDYLNLVVDQHKRFSDLSVLVSLRALSAHNLSCAGLPCAEALVLDVAHACIQPVCDLLVAPVVLSLGIEHLVACAVVPVDLRPVNKDTLTGTLLEVLNVLIVVVLREPCNVLGNNRLCVLNIVSKRHKDADEERTDDSAVPPPRAGTVGNGKND